MKRSLVLLLLIFACLTLGMNQAQGEGQEPGNEAKLGELYINFTLPGLDGEEYTLSDYEGKVLVLTFWGWTCTSCKEVEMPALQSEVFEKYSREQVMVFAISIDPDPDESRLEEMNAYVEEKGLEYPVLYDGLRTGIDYRVFTTPILYFIDKDGLLVYKHGPDTFNSESAQILQDQIDALDVGSEIGKKALEIDLQDLDGNLVRLSDYAGKIVILAFFSTKNLDLQEMLIPLEFDVQSIYGDRVVVLGIVTDENPDREQLRLIQDENCITYRFLINGGRVATYYGFEYPGAVLIDGDGIIQFKEESDTLSEDFFDLLSSLLGF